MLMVVKEEAGLELSSGMKMERKKITGMQMKKSEEIRDGNNACVVVTSD
ncbi:hypothetical protein I309_06100 [Cryptococcus deuterogattii LA55]|nr:hypothetical protein I309_06100 [Cryptococcus deuterogattii LA55]KIR31419.1 hypothetical protein I352_06312 [Cryptococcus deuterogattii MMRL2647]KIR90412.1 hypothetical protein I304_05554 [Cryptococcus deuterogattii CBS 10090]